MATINQINASRINGARSKGPVTPEGKARVAQNGAKHGIYSQIVVLHNEDHSIYLEGREAYLAEWAPSTETEHDLVIDIVDARWRLRRFSTLETAAIDFEVERMRPEVAQTFRDIDEGTRTVLAFNALIVSNRTFEVLQTAVRSQHRIIDRATSQLLRLRKVRPEPASPSPEPPRPHLIATTNPDVAQPAQTDPAQPNSENPRSKPEPAGNVVVIDTARTPKIENRGSKPGDTLTWRLARVA